MQHLENINFSLIVAMTPHQVIGRANALPWHLPADLAHFKSKTLGQAVLMGRKTLEAIGKPLPGRKNLVLSRQKPSLDYEARFPGVIWYSAPEALQAENLWVIGGAEVFAWALPLATLLEITWVEADLAGDTFFPKVPWSAWQLLQQHYRPADAKNAYALTFETWRRSIPIENI